MAGKGCQGLRGKLMVSVIVPVYNTDRECFERCTKSLKAQTDSNFEVIVIDDGSQPECAEMLDSFADGKQFFVIHQQNTGVSEARNNGLRHAKGEYITFLDSDDYVSPNFIKSSSELIRRYGADLVIGGISIVDGRNISECAVKSSHEIIYENTDALRRYLLTAQYEQDTKELKGLRCGGPWCKLYRREVLKNVKFRKNVPVYEDMIFNLEALENVGKIVVSPELWYSYVIYSSSAMRKYRPNGIHEQKLVMQFLKKYKTMHPEVSAAIAKKTGECIKKIVTSTLYHKDSDISGRVSKLKRIFASPRTEYLLESLDLSLYAGLPKSERLFYTLCGKKMSYAIDLIFSIKNIIS